MIKSEGMNVEYVDHMGTDLSVVNAARVSFEKESWWEEEEFNKLKEPDSKLIRYLAKHNHWTPFGHTAVTLRIRGPIAIARQLGKHQTGLVWNEVSRRYVKSEPSLYKPEGWRGVAENVKQGSDENNILDLDQFTSRGTPVSSPEDLWGDTLDDSVEVALEIAVSAYRGLIKAGVCPEQARFVLPQCMNTEWFWTGNLASFSRVCNLRLDKHTQKETRDIAQDIAGVIEPLFPVSWGQLVNFD